MKVIDLLNKLANGEVPKKIKYDNDIYEYNKDYQDYGYFNTGIDRYITLIENELNSVFNLNEEVEIIEDTPKHFGERENQAVKNIIKKNSIPVKENYNDYYEDTPKEDNKIEKLDLQYKDIIYNPNFKANILMYCDNLQFKINEIIDKINGEE